MVSLSADGEVSWLEIDSENESIRSIDSESGYDYLAESQSFAFSPTGNQDAIVSRAGELELWQNAEQILSPFESDNEYTSVAFSPDGTQLATGDNSGQVQLWNIPLTVNGNLPDGETPALTASFQTHQEAVNTLAFSPSDPDLLMTGGENGEIGFWDLSKNIPEYARTTLRSAETITFSPSAVSQPISQSSSRGIERSVNLDRVQRFAVIDGHGQSDSSENAKQFKLWDLQSDGSIRLSETNLSEAVKAELAQANQLVLSPSGNVLIAIAANNTLKAWNLKSGQLIDLQPTSQFESDQSELSTEEISPPVDLAEIKAENAKFSQNGQFLITLGENKSGEEKLEEKTLNLWSIKDDAIRLIDSPVITSIELENLNQISIHPEGNEIAILSEGFFASGSLLETLNLESEARRETKLPYKDSQILFSPDGKLFATVGQDEEREIVRLWTRETLELSDSLKLAKPSSTDSDASPNPELVDVSFSPDSQFILAANSLRELSLWDADGNHIFNFPLAIRSAAFTADGQHIAVVQPNGEILVWSVDRQNLIAEACKLMRTFELGNTSQTDSCPEPSSRTVVSSTGDRLLISLVANPNKLAGISALQ